MSKIIINVEDIQAAWEVLAKFNRLDLHEVELHQNDQVLDISPEIIDRFKFTGLSNKDFILTGFYEE